MGNFTIKINHLIHINIVKLLVNSECLKSVSAAPEHLRVPKTSSSDCFPRAAALVMAVTSLLFAQPKCNRMSTLPTLLECPGTIGVKSRLCTGYPRHGQTPNL